MDTKECVKCGIRHPIQKFYLKSNGKNDKKYYRKECNQCVYKRISSRVTYRETQKRSKATRFTGRDKIHASVLARKEFGSPSKYNCVIPLCEHPAAHLHHFDYSKPLFVLPLCVKHHRAAHTKTD